MVARKRLVVAGIVLLVAVFVGHALYYWAYVNDDAYITFRYSRFLATGRGPYFNPGEHVEGYTNFLLMLLVAAAIALGGAGAAAPFAKGVGVASGALAVGVAYLLARRLGRDASGGAWSAEPAGLAAAGLVAVSPGFAINATSGLETTLYALAIALGVLLSAWSGRDERWRGAGLAFAAAYLARPEGALVFAACWLAQAALAAPALVSGPGDPRRSWLPARRLALDAGIVTLAVGAHLLFRRLAYDGEWLPNTYFAKVGGQRAVTPAWYVSHGVLRPLLGWPGALIALAGLALSRPGRRAATPLLAACAAGVVEPFLTGPDWMPGWRLVIPYLPLMAAWVAVGWALAVERVLASRRLAGATVLACVPVLWLAQGDVRTGLHAHISLRALGYATGHRALARWLDDGAARPGDTVALMDVGIVGYLCPDLRILDISGLTDRTIAKSAGTFLAKDFDPSYVLGRRPRYVILVWTAVGRSYQQPADLGAFEPGTPLDARILQDPRFLRAYVRPRPVDPRTDWKDQLAALVGAERIFEHGHPGRYYLLAAYRRQDGPELARWRTP